MKPQIPYEEFVNNRAIEQKRSVIVLNYWQTARFPVFLEMLGI
jgi:hypothetical protein